MDPPIPPSVPSSIAERGWDGVDVLLVTGDAYVDHPGFAAGLLARLMEANGYRVAVLSQPDWRSADAWRAFPRPRLAVAVSAGAMDSMLNHYTANRRLRSDDAYTLGGVTGRRPDRATAVYCQRSREAFRDVPILCGGIEASLRRLAHYDYWSDRIRRSILLDAKADLLVYGMGERALLEILRRLDAGEPVRTLRDIRGTAYRLGQREFAELDFESSNGKATIGSGSSTTERKLLMGCNTLALPTVTEVTADPEKFCEMTRQIQASLNPYSERVLVQQSGPTPSEAVVVNPPALPLSTAELDAIYDLPYTRSAAPVYGNELIPALEMIRDSVTVVRGCPGGCAFCGLGAHQGKCVQSRSTASVIAEVRRIAGTLGFRGTISDLGGPTANACGLRCHDDLVMRQCDRTSCLFPKRCPNLVYSGEDTGTPTAPSAGPQKYLAMLASAERVPGVQRVLIASGIRMDLAASSPALMRALATHHTGGHLKVAPEHVSDAVLRRMHKPPHATYEHFMREFAAASHECGREQYLVPYFIAGHPGCGLEDAIELAVFLKRNRLRPRQVQDYIPIPMTESACMYYTGMDPWTGERVETAKSGKERAWQRALLQYFLPENDAMVREALHTAGRTDLIGGPDSLVPRTPPCGGIPPRRTSPGKKSPRGTLPRRSPPGKKNRPH